MDNWIKSLALCVRYSNFVVALCAQLSERLLCWWYRVWTDIHTTLDMALFCTSLAGRLTRRVLDFTPTTYRCKHSRLVADSVRQIDARVWCLAEKRNVKKFTTKTKTKTKTTTKKTFEQLFDVAFHRHMFHVVSTWKRSENCICILDTRQSMLYTWP